jgi:hypothetical protein
MKTLGGIRNMQDLPGMVFVVDTKKEINAVNEARRLKIPIVGVVDSNCGTRRESPTRCPATTTPCAPSTCSPGVIAGCVHRRPRALHRGTRRLLG